MRSAPSGEINRNRFSACRVVVSTVSVVSRKPIAANAATRAIPLLQRKTLRQLISIAHSPAWQAHYRRIKGNIGHVETLQVTISRATTPNNF